MNQRFSPWLAFFFLLPFLAITGRSQDSANGVWRQLYSKDTVAFAANLRRAGFPETVVGVLISQEINSRFSAEEARLQPSLETLQSLRDGWSVETREALIRMRKEKNDLLRATLGSVPAETTRVAYESPALAALDPGKRETVRMIFDDYNEMLAQLYARARGTLLEDDKKKLRFLLDERSADFERILGPEKALDYELYATGYLKAWQTKLELMTPTAQEMRDIYLLRKKLDLDVEPRAPSTLLREKQEAALVELEKLWPADRFAAYKRIATGRYPHIHQLVVRLGKPADLAIQIWDAQEAMMIAVYPERFDPKKPERAVTQRVNLTERAENIRRLIQQHIDFVKTRLGESGYQQYYLLNSHLIDTMQDGRAMRTFPSWIF